VAMLHAAESVRPCGSGARGAATRPSRGRIRRPAGRRVGIVTEGGGHGSMAADACVAVGLEVPRLSAAAVAAVREGHPPSAGSNPIDFAIGTTDPDAYERTIPALARSGEIDALLAVGQLGYWATRFPEFQLQVEAEAEGARRAAAAAREAGVPLVVATVYPDATPARALRENGVPVYREITAAARALGRLADHALTEPSGVPDVPSAKEPLSAEPGGAVAYWAAREILTRAGMRFVPARLTAAAVEAAAAAADEIGYPVAVKAQGILHKSDAGGVALGLSDEAELRAAVADMAARLGMKTVSVERMAPLSEGAEVIIGCRQDPRFGPVLLVGLGGIYTELLRDVRTALAPVTEQQAEALFRELRGAPLLTGVRGRPALDLGAAARAAWPSA